jgi:cell cycle arrest protein BUB3
LDTIAWKQTLKDEVPILDATFVGEKENAAISGGLDGKIRSHNLDIAGSNPKAVREMKNMHDGGVGCVGWCNDLNVGVSGGWDKQFCTWDLRAKCERTNVAELPGKAFSLGVSSCRAVVACSDRNILIYDLRNLSKPEQVRQSSLQQQIRVVSCSPPELDAYAIGTVDGRVAIEYFNPKVHTKKKFAFKCHRVKEEKQVTAYPVNAISFHPKYGTFATGGGDGHVVTWDATNRKRITQYSQYPTSISALSFNFDGSRLAIASSYTYERGEIENKPKDSIFVRVIKTEEVEPKKSKKRSRGKNL